MSKQLTSEQLEKKKGTKLWKKRLKKFCANRLSLIATIFLIIFVAACLAAPLLTEYDPMAPDFSVKEKAPNAEHILGTDSLGRDVFCRLLYGGRISLYIGVVSAVIGAAIGAVIGALSGYFSGWLDKVLLRLSELFSTFPQTILIMVMMTFIGQSTNNLILIFAITGWTGTFRLVRSQMFSLREETYVEVCKSFGMKDAVIVFKQILPATITTCVVHVTVNIPGYIMSEAGLSFLGLGVPATVPTWGTMLNAAKGVKVIMNCPWLWLVPGAAICLIVMAFNFLGDGLRDVLDPRQ